MFALIVSLLISFLTVACSDNGARSRLSSGTTVTAGSADPGRALGGYIKGDDDADEGANAKDEDDGRVRDYGHAANATERQAVTALVRRHYAASAAGDGATACGLMLSRLTGDPSLGDAAEELHPPAPGAPLLHGKSCIQVMSQLFKENHLRLAADSATLHVIAVRINGAHGLVLLGFGATPERQISVTRDGHVWKIGSLVDDELP